MNSGPGRIGEGANSTQFIHYTAGVGDGPPGMSRQSVSAPRLTEIVPYEPLPMPQNPFTSMPPSNMTGNTRVGSIQLTSPYPNNPRQLSPPPQAIASSSRTRPPLVNALTTKQSQIPAQPQYLATTMYHAVPNALPPQLQQPPSYFGHVTPPAPLPPIMTPNVTVTNYIPMVSVAQVDAELYKLHHYYGQQIEGIKHEARRQAIHAGQIVQAELNRMQKELNQSALEKERLQHQVDALNQSQLEKAGLQRQVEWFKNANEKLQAKLQMKEAELGRMSDEWEVGRAVRMALHRQNVSLRDDVSLLMPRTKEGKPTLDLQYQSESPDATPGSPTEPSEPGQSTAPTTRKRSAESPDDAEPPQKRFRSSNLKFEWTPSLPLPPEREPQLPDLPSFNPETPIDFQILPRPQQPIETLPKALGEISPLEVARVSLPVSDPAG
ncbi:hypothetical protein BDN72DRAFT_843294 [Pluteus cervinus]|uniref:Uncharacterized protein n=1 Tax=Pluteus cervinus TaxID=181527 RepID=A0ACD3ANN8_9AGAR|nr:hypothetical protein BDN72DRAFT_843294 [Pluteus cervinus]